MKLYLKQEKPSRAETSKKLRTLQDELDEAYAKQKALEQKVIIPNLALQFP